MKLIRMLFLVLFASLIGTAPAWSATCYKDTYIPVTTSCTNTAYENSADFTTPCTNSGGTIQSVAVTCPTFKYSYLAARQYLGESTFETSVVGDFSDTKTEAALYPSITNLDIPATYSITPALPAGLQLNQSTGTIFGTATDLSSARTYTITMTVSGASFSDSFTLSVLSQPQINYADTVMFVSMAETLDPTRAGIPTEAVYSIKPSLPDGLTLNTTTGRISGTPSAVSAEKVYTVTVQAGARTTTNAFTLSVLPKPTLSYPNTTANAGADLTISPVVSNIPLGSTFSVSPALPTGLALNSASGLISGTPTTGQTAKTYTVTLSSYGKSFTDTFSLTINAFHCVTIKSYFDVSGSTTPFDVRSYTVNASDLIIGGVKFQANLTTSIFPNTTMNRDYGGEGYNIGWYKNPSVTETSGANSLAVSSQTSVGTTVTSATIGRSTFWSTGGKGTTYGSNYGNDFMRIEVARKLGPC